MVLAFFGLVSVFNVAMFLLNQASSDLNVSCSDCLKFGSSGMPGVYLVSWLVSESRSKLREVF